MDKHGRDNINTYMHSLGKDPEFIRNMETVQSRKIAQERNAEKFNANTKARLITNIAKKFKTTYIGAIASFEAAFGHLWGHNKEGELTKEEQAFAELWNKVRTEVLDKGNNNSRAAQEEIAQHDVTYNKYQADLIVKK